VPGLARSRRLLGTPVAEGGQGAALDGRLEDTRSVRFGLGARGSTAGAEWVDCAWGGACGPGSCRRVGQAALPGPAVGVTG